ncbi:DUF397 domain-containing protein, partial [Micromonospora sp. NPDC047753]|uniref:DUF397 domain-containing protein n=1 Tax=Micromonospora sp. NPDC047753 TaxID=3154817 RepID=UPI00340DF657
MVSPIGPAACACHCATQSTSRSKGWRTSTRSQTSNCVEVAPLAAGPSAVALRDSK